MPSTWSGRPRPAATGRWPGASPATSPGKYTVERPLHLGAALVGRLDDLAEPLSAYGLPLGEAFQMRDDVLGTFGDPAVTGKPVGEDLREGKPTPLLAIATARAGARRVESCSTGSARPTSATTRSPPSRRSWSRPAPGRRRSGSSTRLAAEAVAALDKAALTAEARAALAELAAFVARRDR